MPLNKLDNFLKNVEGRILYVSPSDLDASDAMSNQGNSQTTPFKTIQRALIEAARFSYVPGNNNDITEKTTILLMPGEHVIDNRPGYKIKNIAGQAKIFSPTTNGYAVSNADDINKIGLNLDSNFDINQEDNILYKFNSVHGGVIVPRGTSIVGLDLRKTKIRPKYVPNPTDTSVPESAIFRITGACYFWQFSLFDGKLTEKVYVKNNEFSGEHFVKPSFSHHKLTCFEYADGINKDENTNLTDLNMYYYKLSIAYGTATEDRNISDKFPGSTEGFVSKRPEFEIVGAFAADPIKITSIESGSGGVASQVVTVTTQGDHGLDVGTPIRIKGVSESDYNVSTNVATVDSSNSRVFTYVLPDFKSDIIVNPTVTEAQIIVETDTVNGASPYIFNISLRSVFGMNGMHADGDKATGFRSMVVAQFTGVSLQKDDRAFAKYNPTSGIYESLSQSTVSGAELANKSSAASSEQIYHLDSDAIYRSGWETRHVKISNNAILQIVSVFAIGYNTHFEAQSGSDASITNSNSNFGQLALVSDGFRKDAFQKDDRAFITHIIPPRAITTAEENIDWVSIDQGKNGNTKRLYLFGFNDKDIKPPSLTQGFRIGAKRGDKLFVDISGVIKEAEILMPNENGDPTHSSVKEITVDHVSLSSTNIVFKSKVLSDHQLETGEKVIIISDDGDLPQNIEEKTVYFVIRISADTFKLASSKTNADNGEFVKAYRGTNLKVLSRVTDKNSGDVGHPVQWDGSQWYVNVRDGNTIVGALSGTAGERTEPTFVKRISDTRSLDERIYKLRLAIPKEIDNAKNPENGFIIQESANTGIASVSDFTQKPILTREDFLRDRNPRFISTCTFTDGSKTVSITAERPHNLTVGDLVTVKNITDTNNSVGIANSSYNLQTTVTGVPDSLTFEYSTGNVTIPDFATNNFNDKTSDNAIDYPRFERTDLKSNIYIFRNNVISEYINDTQDGVYQVFALNSSNFIPTEYTGLNYSQNVVDVYPQIDRDNIDENPRASKSFALRSPLGQVITNDPLKSITRETNDKLMQKIGMGVSIFSFTDNTTTGIVSFTQEHNLAGIVTATVNGTGGSGYNNGTHLNVKVFNSTTQNDSTWNGTLATVVVGGGKVTGFEITNTGSGWQVGNKGYFDKSVIAGGDTTYLDGAVAGAGLTASNIGISTNLVLQTTGIGITSDGYFRITSVNDKKQVSIAKSAGDILPTADQYGFIINPSSQISSKVFISSSGISSITTIEPHGLVAGNRFQLNDSNNQNQGSFVVKTRVGVNTFTFESTSDIVTTNGHILKHGLSANDGVSERGNENLSIRGVELYDFETGKLHTSMDNVGSAVTFSTSTSNVLDRFPYGSYILIDEEIMRVSTNSLGGSSNPIITVIRGVFGTLTSSHDEGSLIKKVKPFPIQFNRPSILRASGHTFEYLGYGPGNYSTALPQVQLKTISEKEEFLSQSQERAGGAVVYTGMNNKGDFYIGNQKKSALTGEETSFDTPIPSVAGEDPGRLSVVFDETTIKERLVVEGGKSKTALSEFDGPVTFNNEVQSKDSIKIKSSIQSTSATTGSLVVTGGVGISSDVNITGSVSIGGTSALNNNVSLGGTTLTISSNINSDILPDATANNRDLGSTTKKWAEVHATTFYGDGSNLDGINNSQLFDSNDVERVGANTSGVVITGITTIAGSTTIDGNNIQITNVGTGSSVYLSTDGGIQINRKKDNDGPYIDFTYDGGDFDARIQLDVTGGGTAASDGELIFFVPTPGQGNLPIAPGLVLAEKFRVERTGAKVTGALEVTGDITALTSDIRLKDEISPITKALEKVNSLSGFTYKHNEIAKLKCDIDTGDQTYAGVSAQDVQKVLPEAVKPAPSNNDYLTVQYEKLVPLLIEAVKELSAKVDTLESMAHPKPTGKTQKRNEDRLDALENQINN